MIQVHHVFQEHKGEAKHDLHEIGWHILRHDAALRKAYQTLKKKRSRIILLHTLRFTKNLMETYSILRTYDLTKNLISRVFFDL